MSTSEPSDDHDQFANSESYLGVQFAVPSSERTTRLHGATIPSLATEPTSLKPIHDPPILSLPFEVLAEIFLLYTGEIYDTDECYTNSKPGRSTPLLLAGVCRSWRDISLTTARLWTTIKIFIYSLDKTPLLAEIAKCWMARSGQLPLSISFSIATSILKWEMAHVYQAAPLIEVIRYYSSRWRRLTLYIPADLYEDLTDPLTFTPVLQDLRIFPVVTQDSDRLFIFRLAKAPLLSRLETSCVSVNNIQIPWLSLTTLNVDSIFVDETLELLKLAVQLISAKFSDICGNGSVFELPTTPLTHYHLRHLDVRPEYDTFRTETSLLFQNIILPSLESFTYYAQDYFLVNELQGFFRRSRSPIIFELVIPDGNPSVTEAEFIHLLSGLSCITTLSVSVFPSPSTRKIVTDCFIHQLYLSPDFLPNLEVLNFFGMHGFSWESIADLWLSNRIGLKLRHVNIKLCNEDKPGSLPFYIDKDSLTRMHGPNLRLPNKQATLNITDHTTGMDMISASLAFHGLTLKV
ncbi:hypothetical protein GALMADRAFT_912491 [Galerina marginata CBS 339.88]|uniref:Uncharacterized protein n=1 Tax=Galerina marginata (strain CBS 339.88) TaxID=685588 RepID=A0A067SST6_GALM3|nr:hypothetical protein GALMADRAFT_912491 [Galerina marginata CBS 339.88]